MSEALAGTPESEMARPGGIVQVRIDPRIGERAAPEQDNAIQEVFRSDNVPEEQAGNGLSGGKDDANLPRNLF